MVEVLGIIFVTGLFLLFFMLKSAFSNTVKYEQLSFEDFPESAKALEIFFISDIHRRTINDKVISEAAGKVDIVIIGGDLTEKGVSFERIRKNISKLKSLGTVYFIWGNNDYEVDCDQFRKLLISEGTVLLENSSVLMDPDSPRPIALIGVEDLSLHRDDFDAAFAQVPENAFKILLAHNPAAIKKLGTDQKVSLMLSGHTHGGQIRLFGFGLYQLGGTGIIKDTTVLVSNGYGTTALPLRLGAPSETHLITIKRK
ncbi:metallophosphoesterase [Bacillus sp. AK031]